LWTGGAAVEGAEGILYADPLRSVGTSLQSQATPLHRTDIPKQGFDSRIERGCFAAVEDFVKAAESAPLASGVSLRIRDCARSTEEQALAGESPRDGGIWGCLEVAERETSRQAGRLPGHERLVGNTEPSNRLTPEDGDCRARGGRKVQAESERIPRG
jgi:hypothetical protein